MANIPLQTQRFVPLPESEDPELEKFRIRSTVEIAHVFRDMSKAGEMITAYPGEEFFLTALLGVDADNGRFFLDYGADERLNQRALQAERVLFAGRHLHVRVQFTTGPLARVNLADGPALSAPFPGSILRIQRREFYRLTTPLGAPPLCRITAADGRILEAVIVDISLGGFGIIETENQRLWEPGQVLEKALIQLPDGTEIQSDVEIRSRHDVHRPGGPTQYHVGCKFLHLESRMNTLIQRYIRRIDLERRRLK